jgi:diacylglycerol kinase (ATP)
VREAIQREHFSARFVETRSRGELQELAARAIAEGTRVLVAMGGDGTAQALIQEAAGRDVLVGLIPTGGGNDFADALGLPRQPAVAARALKGGRLRLVDILRVKTADGERHIYAGGGGIGLDAETSHFSAQQYRNWPGRLRYVASALHAYRDFDRLRVRVDFPGTALPSMEDSLLVAAVMNAPTYGSGLQLAPAACVDDGMLDVVTIEYLPLAKILRLIPRLLRSGKIATPGMKRIASPRVCLTPDRPCFFHGDGEILGPAPVEIEVLPKALQVLVSRAPLKPVG